MSLIHFDESGCGADDKVLQQQLADLYNQEDVNGVLTRLGQQISGICYGEDSQRRSDFISKFGGTWHNFDIFVASQRDVTPDNLTIAMFQLAEDAVAYPQFLNAEDTAVLPNMLRQIIAIVNAAPDAGTLKRSIAGSEGFKRTNPETGEVARDPYANTRFVSLSPDLLKQFQAPARVVNPSPDAGLTPDAEALTGKIVAVLDKYNAELQRITAPYIIELDMDTPEGEEAYENLPRAAKALDVFARTLRTAAECGGLRNTEDFEMLDAVEGLRTLYAELGKQPVPSSPLAPATTQQDRLLLLSIFNEITKTVEQVLEADKTPDVVEMIAAIKELTPRITISRT